MSRQHSKPQKAYKNLEFLNSPDARVIRLISEFLEPARRFRQQSVRDTIVFFGSARTRPRREVLSKLKRLQRRAQGVKSASKAVQRAIEAAQVDLEVSRYYEDAVKLARLLTEWSKKLYQQNRFVICSGGGPGIMEAANRGAKLAGGRSIGLNISLPFEQSANKFVTNGLDFEFHYFFMRKFWFVYLAKALVMFPGGFGTMDEIFEVLTLLQTGKIKKKMTVLLYGKAYWEEVLNFQKLVDLHMISPDELKLFTFADSPEEAYRYLIKELKRNYPNETTESNGVLSGPGQLPLAGWRRRQMPQLRISRKRLY
ncbi:MAG: TIGR00730 family Rossman fold protein [Ignavibacteria bacterium]|nr:TIGR00730 family Rossman fold protein [Ignavibacteria bacterium]